jgi:hypothetical protein
VKKNNEKENNTITSSWERNTKATMAQTTRFDLFFCMWILLVKGYLGKQSIVVAKDNQFLVFH